MKWDLLKQIIEYINQIKKGKTISINFTTNATLLTSEMIKYLVQNDIHIGISLDGPKNVHDRYRVFRNGKGTFNTVLRNVKRIKRISNDYFNNNVTFVIILSPPFDPEEIIDFFYKDPLFIEKHGYYNFSQIDVKNTSFFSDFNLERAEIDRMKAVANLYKKYNKFLIEGKYNELTLEKKLFDRDFHKIHMREMKPLLTNYPVHGTCFPGLKKLFIDVFGDFYMCERVGNNYKLGNINTGFNFDKIKMFFSESEEFFAECRNCWALRLCSKCFNSINKGDSFDESTRRQFCKITKANIVENLKSYCEIRENNINAFEPLKDIVYA